MNVATLIIQFLYITMWCDICVSCLQVLKMLYPVQIQRDDVTYVHTLFCVSCEPLSGGNTFPRIQNQATSKATYFSSASNLKLEFRLEFGSVAESTTKPKKPW